MNYGIILTELKWDRSTF